MKFLKFFAIFLFCLVLAESANILAIFPFPHYSHQKFAHTIVQSLVERGHSFTIFTTIPHDYGNNPNVTQHHFTDTDKIHQNHTDMVMYKREKIHWSRIMLQYEMRAFYESAKLEMEHPEMQNLINNSSDFKFDLILTECILCPHFKLAEIFDCPIAFVSSSDAHETSHEIFGNKVDAMKFSEVMLMPYIHGNLTLIEQINSFGFYIFNEIIFKLVFYVLTSKLNWMYFSHLGTNVLKFPTNRLSLLVTNTSPAFGHVRPLLPNSIQAGYIHIEKPKQLTDFKLKKFLDNSDNGVIVMALGSRVDSRNLGAENIQKFMRAFNKTNMNVLWKLNAVDEDIEFPHNIEIVQWMPLADVLAHPNVKLVIHHGGLLTSYEAIDREVPMIIIPLAYDQNMNARLMVKNNIAKELDLNNFNELELVDAIVEMTKPIYVKNIKEMRRLAYDRPINSRDLVVWHVENAIRNKIVYSDRLGQISILQSPLLHIWAYFVVFLVSLWILVRKKLWKM